MLYIIDVHIFSQEDIALNTKTLGWPVKIRPVFEQNTEVVEDCKARFEDNLQKKSEWTSRELEKLSTRVQELEELGEIANVQQYTYEVRMVQNKLKSIEDTIVWINQVIIIISLLFLSAISLRRTSKDSKFFLLPCAFRQNYPKILTKTSIPC